VKPFGDAMVKLEKGKYTEVPVQTQFGWHVILVEDVRQAKFPSFEMTGSPSQSRFSQRVGSAKAKVGSVDQARPTAGLAPCFVAPPARGHPTQTRAFRKAAGGLSSPLPAARHCTARNTRPCSIGW
jgi:hypothetical protein